MDHEKAYDHVAWLRRRERPAARRDAGRARTAEAQLTRDFEQLGLTVERHAFRQPAYRATASRAACGAGRRAGRARAPAADLVLRRARSPEPVRGQFLHVGNGSEGYVRRLDPGRQGAADLARLVPSTTRTTRSTGGCSRVRPAAVLRTTNGGAAAPLDTFFDWEKHEQEPPPPTVVVHYRDAERSCTENAGELELLLNFEDRGRRVREPDRDRCRAPTRRPARVIVSAHYDTAPTGAGAVDNAGGTAMVQCLAEWLAAETAAGRRPRRTVRFVVYSGLRDRPARPARAARGRPKLLERDHLRAQLRHRRPADPPQRRLRDRGAVW